MDADADALKNLGRPHPWLRDVMKMEEHKKEKCFLQKKNVIKEETNEEKLNRFIFEACEKCVSNPDSETEFDTILEQCASEKSRKVKINNGRKKI